MFVVQGVGFAGDGVDMLVECRIQYILKAVLSKNSNVFEDSILFTKLDL